MKLGKRIIASLMSVAMVWNNSAAPIAEGFQNHSSSNGGEAVVTQEQTTEAASGETSAQQSVASESSIPSDAAASAEDATGSVSEATANDAPPSEEPTVFATAPPTADATAQDAAERVFEQTLTLASGQVYLIRVTFDAGTDLPADTQLVLREYNEVPEHYGEPEYAEQFKNRPLATEIFLSKEDLENRVGLVAKGLQLSEGQDRIYAAKFLNLSLVSDGAAFELPAAARVEVETNAIDIADSPAVEVGYFDWAEQRPEAVVHAIAAENKTENRSREDFDRDAEHPLRTKLSFVTDHLGDIAFACVARAKLVLEEEGERFVVQAAGPLEVRADDAWLADETMPEGQELRSAFTVQTGNAPAYGAPIWMETTAVKDAAQRAAGTGYVGYRIADGALGERVFGTEGTSSPLAVNPGDTFALTWDTGKRGEDDSQVSVEGSQSENTQVKDEGSIPEPRSDASSSTAPAQEPTSPAASAASPEALPSPKQLSEYVSYEQMYTSSDGRTYRVTVGCDEGANIPSGALLKVSEIVQGGREYFDYVVAAADTLGVPPTSASMAKVLDISFVNPTTGEEYQPGKGVKLSIVLVGEDLDTYEQVDVIHFPDGEGTTPEVVESAQSGSTVEFVSDGFSVFVVMGYTVDFTYEGYTYNLAGGGEMLLSELLGELGIETDLTGSSAWFSSDMPAGLVELTATYGEDGRTVADWRITSLQPFNTEHTLTVKLADGAKYLIDVTDAVHDHGTWTNGSSGSGEWSIDDDGVLTITGTGRMPDYTAVKDTPWNTYRQSTSPLITKLVVGDGITYLGSNILTRAYSLVEIDVSGCTTLQSAGTDLFKMNSYDGESGTGSLAIVNFAGNPNFTSFGSKAFTNCSKITTIDMSGTNINSITNYISENKSALKTLNLKDCTSTASSFTTQDLSGYTKLVDVNLSGTKITSFKLPNNNATLTTLSVPTTITSLQNLPNCRALTALYFDGTQAEWEAKGFSVPASATVYYLKGATGESFSHELTYGSANATTLSQLLVGCGVTAATNLTVANVASVSMDDTTLVSVTEDEGDWQLEGLKASDTVGTLTLTLKNQTTITIQLTVKKDVERTSDLGRLIATTSTYTKSGGTAAAIAGSTTIPRASDVYDLNLAFAEFAESNIDVQIDSEHPCTYAIPAGLTVCNASGEPLTAGANVAQFSVTGTYNETHYEIPVTVAYEVGEGDSPYLNLAWNYDGVPSDQVEAFKTDPSVAFTIPLYGTISSSQSTLTFGQDVVLTVSAPKALMLYTEDSADATVKLPGAEYSVYAVSDERAALRTYTSDDDGIVRVNENDQVDTTKYAYDTLYSIVETTAPVNYELSSEKTYFYFSDGDQVPEGLPVGATAYNLMKVPCVVSIKNVFMRVSISAQKLWGYYGNKSWPTGVDHVIVGLYQSVDGGAETPVTDATGNLRTLRISSSTPNATVTFEDLPAQNAERKPITYTVKELHVYADSFEAEDIIDQYVRTIEPTSVTPLSNGNGEGLGTYVGSFTIKNAPPLKTITVTKSWNGERSDGTKVKLSGVMDDTFTRSFQLYRTTDVLVWDEGMTAAEIKQAKNSQNAQPVEGAEYSFTLSNDQSKTFTDLLPEADNGDEYTYFAVESSPGEDTMYRMSGTTLTVDNYLSVVDYTVNKKWYSDAGQTQQITDATKLDKLPMVYFDLYRSTSGEDATDAEEVQTGITIDDAHDWTVTIRDLEEKNGAGTAYHYYVRETNTDVTPTYSTDQGNRAITISNVVNKPVLVITAANANKAYDGTALTTSDYQVTGLQTGHSVASVTVTGSQTLVGESDNVASAAKIVDESGTEVTSQYAIFYINGTLTVTKKALTITAGSAEKAYDGTPLTTNTYTSTELAEGDSIESVTITGSQTDAGSSASVPSGAIIRNASNLDVTDCYDITYESGALSVDPLVTVKKTLDGDAGSVDQFDITLTLTDESGNPVSTYKMAEGIVTDGYGVARLSIPKANVEEAKILRVPYKSNLTILEDAYYDYDTSYLVNGVAINPCVLTSIVANNTPVVVLNGRAPICKIGDETFRTLRDAMAYIEENAMATATIEMLLDYTIPPTDALEVPTNFNVTLTTASTSDASHPYVPTTAGNEIAVITRKSDYTTGNIIKNDGTLTLTNVKLDGNTVSASAALLANYGSLTIGSGTTITRAVSTGNGGAIYNEGESVSILGDALLNANHAANGGAIYSTTGTIEVAGRLAGNQATTDGGGIYAETGAITVTGTLDHNHAAGSGGAVHSDAGSITMSEGSSVTVNNATSKGGAFYIGTGSVSVSGGSMEQNSSEKGGGIYAEGGSVTISNAAVLTSNTATQNGAAVYTVSGTASVTGGSVTRNAAMRDGGALYTDSGVIEVSGGELADNTADEYGGALCANSGSLSVSGGTIGTSGHPNSAVNGAAAFVYTGSATLSGGAIKYNAATNGGAVGVGGATARLYFSGGIVVTDNTMGDETSNVYLNVDSDYVINAAGLSSSAHVGIYVPGNLSKPEDLLINRGQACSRFGTFSNSSNVSAFTNDRVSGLSVFTNDTAKKLIWNKTIQVEARYISQITGSMSSITTGSGSSKYTNNAYQPVVSSGGISGIADDLVANYSLNVGSTTATYAGALTNLSTTYVNYVSQIAWDNTHDNGDGTYGAWSVPKRDGSVEYPTKVFIFYSEPTYIAIENNTDYELTISSMTVGNSQVKQVIDSADQAGYGLLFSKNDAIQSDLLSVSASDLTLPAGESRWLLIPGSWGSQAYTFTGTYRGAPAGTTIPLSRTGVTTPDDLTAEEVATGFTRSGSLEAAKGGITEIIFGGKRPICRIYTEEIDDADPSEYVAKATVGSKVEYVFGSLNDAVFFVESHIEGHDALKNPKVEMLTNYLIPDDDVVSLPTGINFTFDTASKIDDSDTYYFKGNDAKGRKRATISRRPNNTSSFIVVADGDGPADDKTTNLTVQNLNFDGRAIAGSIDGGVVKTKNCANVTINEVDFANCIANNGGGIFIEWGDKTWGGTPGVYYEAPNGSLNVTNAIFTNCSTEKNQANRAGGGAIWTNVKNVTLSGSTFTSCKAYDQAGAVFHRIDLKCEATTTVTGCTFTDCKARAAGGLEIDSGVIDVSGCTFKHCVATNRNGGGFNIFCFNAKDGKTSDPCSATVTGCTFEDCTANQNGGGLRSITVTTTVSNCSFTNTSAATGGGISLSNGSAQTAEINGCTISGSTATTYGGGIYCVAKVLTVQDYTDSNTGVVTQTSVTNCTATNDGGGIYHKNNGASSSTTVTNAKIQGNTTSASGGGLYTNARTVMLTSTDVLDNTASGNGGGVYDGANNNNYNLVFDGCTVSGNSSGGQGGGVYANVRLTLRNGTTVTGNTLTTDTAEDAAGVYMCQNRTLVLGMANAQAAETSTVYGNTTLSGTDSNVRLWTDNGINNKDSVSVLCDLEGDIYVVNAAARGTQFGSASAAGFSGLSDLSHVFISDDGLLYGVIDGTDPSGKKIIWRGNPVCKITDGAGALLFFDANGKSPAIFDVLDDGTAEERTSAFSTLRAENTPELYDAEGNLYEGGAYCVKMLVESYRLDTMITTNTNDSRSITLTTAGGSDADHYPYRGRTGTKSTITRSVDNADGSMLTVNLDMTIEGVTLDGGSMLDGFAAGSNTSVLYVNGTGSVTLGNRAVLQNAGTTGNGGGVYLNSGSLTVGGGSINNCSADKGGGVYQGGSSEFTLASGSITNCHANNGAGAYIADDFAMTMQGGSITGNTATQSGGGIAVGGTADESSAELHFAGAPVVSGNKCEASVASGKACNVELSADSNAVINTTGLTDDAVIGIYVPGEDTQSLSSLYDKHGEIDKPFGSYRGTNTRSFHCFVNDRNALKGTAHADDHTIIWAAVLSLRVEKTVVSERAADQNDVFRFTITLSDQSVNGVHGDMTFTGGEANITLSKANGWELTAEDLPNGATYTVTENLTNAQVADYDVTPSRTISGTIGENLSNNNVTDQEERFLSTAAFTNTRKKGRLQVSKVLDSAYESDASAEFRFYVTLDDSTISGPYGAMRFVNGEAMTGTQKGFVLHGGESLMAENLPTDVHYTVKESLSTDQAKYLVAHPSASQQGTIGERLTNDSSTSSDLSVVMFTNTHVICKITNSSGALLYYRDNDNNITPAAYRTLKEAFDMVNASRLCSNRGISYTGACNIEMLIPDYTLPQQVTLVSGRVVTLTTAKTTDASYPYMGGEGTQCLITRGFTGSSMISDDGRLTLDKITLDGGSTASTPLSSTAHGGIVQTVTSTATLTTTANAQLQNSVTSGTGSANVGGAVWLAGGSSMTHAGTISGCSAGQGGAIYVESGSSTASVSGAISGCSATGVSDGTTTKASGGAIKVGQGATLNILDGATLSGNNVTNNGDSDRGGAIYADGSVVMSGGTITGNGAYRQGGAIYLSSTGSMGMSGGSISSNNAASGGAVYVNAGATMALTGGTISNNVATAQGGGIYLAGTLTMEGGGIANNGASNGAGVYVASGATMTLSDGSVAFNAATAQGGGVYLAGALNMIGGTITLNTASDDGGAVFAASGATMSMSSGTIVGNTSTGDGAGIYLTEGSKLSLSGSPSFGNAGANQLGNPTASTISGAYNGSDALTRQRQDIFIEGYFSGDASSLVIAGPLDVPAGSIWVWAQEASSGATTNHFEMRKQFAVFESEAVRTSMSEQALTKTFEAFRNAQPNNVTLCADTYLSGASGAEFTNVYWSGGFDVSFQKVDGYGVGQNDATFTLYTDEAASTEYLQGGSSVWDTSHTVTAGDASVDGVVAFRTIPAGTFYMKETQTPSGYTNNTVYRLVIDPDGKYRFYIPAHDANGNVKKDAATGATVWNRVYYNGSYYQVLNTNDIARRVILQKVDDDGAPLAGAEFRIFDAVWSELKDQIYESGSAGAYFIDDLPYGTYYLVETEFPSSDYMPANYGGYKPDDSTTWLYYILTVGPDGTTVVGLYQGPDLSLEPEVTPIPDSHTYDYKIVLSKSTFTSGETGGTVRLQRSVDDGEFADFSEGVSWSSDPNYVSVSGDSLTIGSVDKPEAVTLSAHVNNAVVATVSMTILPAGTVTSNPPVDPYTGNGHTVGDRVALYITYNNVKFSTDKHWNSCFEITAFNLDTGVYDSSAIDYEASNGKKKGVTFKKAGTFLITIKTTKAISKDNVTCPVNEYVSFIITVDS